MCTYIYSRRLNIAVTKSPTQGKQSTTETKTESEDKRNFPAVLLLEAL